MLSKIRYAHLNRELSRFGYLIRRDPGFVTLYCGAPDPIFVSTKNDEAAVMAEIKAACHTLRPEIGTRLDWLFHGTRV